MPLLERSLAFLACLFMLACILEFIILLCIRPARKHIEPVQPIVDYRVGHPSGLAQSFANSADGTIVLEANKPLEITTTRDGYVKNAFCFSSLGSSLAPTAQSTVRGFTFAVAQPLNVVALQVIDQLFTDGARQVGIFRMSDGILVCSTTVSKQQDPLIQGFRTHFLLPKERVLLASDAIYACVALLKEADIAVDDNTNNVALPINDVYMDFTDPSAPDMVGQVGSIVSSTLALPTNFAKKGVRVVPFGSLQLQAIAVPRTSIFDVDQQCARFPPQYLKGFQLSIINDRISPVSVLPGFAASVYGDYNLVAQQIVQGVQLARLAPATFYAVFVVDTAPRTEYNPEIVLSPNFCELQNVPTNRIRRLGWARTHTDSPFLIPSQQIGDGVRRQTIYRELVREASLVMQARVAQIVTFAHIPPTAQEATIRISITFPSSSDLPSTVLAMTSSLLKSDFQIFEVNQQYQSRDITFPLQTTTIPQQARFTLSFTPAVAAPRVDFDVIGYSEDL